MKSLMPTVCESLYYIFLLAYEAGLRAYLKRSEDKAGSSGEARVSTGDWEKALQLAGDARQKATNAATDLAAAKDGGKSIQGVLMSF